MALLLALVLSLLLALVLIAIRGIGLNATRAGRLQPSSPAPLVGTWKGDKLGNFLNFRSDGTARARPSSGGEIGYFDWTLDESGELAIYQYSSKNRAWKARALTTILGLPPTDRYQAIEISATRMKLLSSHNGEVFTFTRTTDGGLETAP